MEEEEITQNKLQMLARNVVVNEVNEINMGYSIYDENLWEKNS